MSDDENILLGPGAFRVWSVRHGHTLNHFPKESDEMSDLIELRTWLDIVAEKDAEIARLKEIKTPASAALVNITKAMLDEANAKIARLQAALEEIEALKDSGKDWKLTDAKIIARKALEGKL